MPFCSNCRSQIPDGVDRCPKCGNEYKRFSQPTQTNTTTSQPVNNTKGKLLKTKLKKWFKTDNYTSEYPFDSTKDFVSYAIILAVKFSMEILLWFS